MNKYRKLTTLLLILVIIIQSMVNPWNFTNVEAKDDLTGFREQWDTIPYGYGGTKVMSNSGGVLKVTSLSVNPMIFMYNVGSYDPNLYRYIEVRYRMEASINTTNIKIHFTNNNTSPLNIQEQVVESSQLIADGQWHNCYIDLWSNDKYRTGGNITGWRYDWATTKDVTMDLDYISLIEKPAIYEEQWNSISYGDNDTNVISDESGILKVTSTSCDPMIYMYHIGFFDPNIYRYMEIRYKMNESMPATAYQIYFTNNEYKSVYTNEQGLSSGLLIADGQWHTCYLDMWSNPKYLTGGNITGWRYDWATADNVTLELDYIHLVATDVITPIEPSIKYNATEINETCYKVYAINTGIDTSQVLFPTWTTANEQDDIVWHVGKYIGNNTWEATIYTTDHNNECGEYITHVYTYDRANKPQIIGTANFNITKVEPSIKYNDSIVYDSYYKVYAINTTSNTSKVLFPTWSTSNGQDDLIWHEGIYIGNSTWEAIIPVQGHNNETGEYITHVYTYDSTNTSQMIGSATFHITQITSSIAYNDTNVSDTFYKVYAINTASDTTQVLFPTWTASNEQDDLIWHAGKYIGNNTWEATIPVQDHNNESGEYVTHVYTSDITNAFHFIGGAVFNITKAKPTIKYDKTNIDTSSYKVYAINISSDTVQVLFPTWTSPNGQDDIIWHTGKNIGNGIWEATINIKDHYNECGEYITHVYTYDSTNTSHFIGSANFNITILGLVYQYDANGRLIRVLKDGKPYITNEYDKNGNLLSGQVVQ